MRLESRAEVATPYLSWWSLQDIDYSPLPEPGISPLELVSSASKPSILVSDPVLNDSKYCTLAFGYRLHSSAN